MKMKGTVGVLAVLVWAALLSIQPRPATAETRTEDEDCSSLLETADYKTHTLYGLLYEQGCVPKGWEEFFNGQEIKEMMHEISERLRIDSQEHNLGLNPKIGWVFRAFHMVPPDKVKVIILGQDPAPQPGLATGLSFSLDEDVLAYKVPSVQRVILEARNEGYCINHTNGVLIKWAEQGVLLLNTALTLIEKKIASHLTLWRTFSREVLSYVSDKCPPSVWILWGSKAKYFIKKIDQTKHYIVAGGHPSPMAKPQYFFCQNYFSCANQWLCGQGRGVIDWNLAPSPCEKLPSRLFNRKYSDPGFYEKEECEMQHCPCAPNQNLLSSSFYCRSTD